MCFLVNSQAQIFQDVSLPLTSTVTLGKSMTVNFQELSIDHQSQLKMHQHSAKLIRLGCSPVGCALSICLKASQEMLIMETLWKSACRRMSQTFKALLYPEMHKEDSFLIV